ncbi:efflux RND transporter permease subunit [uncultured Ruthenibacterium sp.]|uniref:efflux RND transporter permease subunit n=1 Tax=uncultured Ruthenibacterium sp. TaxID=1905347 RepID=UPI00349ED942
MLSHYSVKKPFTVLVAVVLVLVLGVVSFMGMTTDLLPSIELPYVMVVTTYAGASPEKIEMTVTKPLESVLGTTGGVKNVQSISSENSSLVILEFEQGTNMDSAMIELSSNVDLVKAQLDDAVGTPMLLQISPDMLPVMIASVDVNGMDVAAVSDYAQEEIIPEFERLSGVASVDATGLVERQVSVTLDQAKIDSLNDRVLANVDGELADAQAELRDSQAQLNSGKAQLEQGKQALNEKKDSTLDQLADASAQVDSASAQVSALLSEETSLTASQKAFEAEKQGYQQALDGWNAINNGLSSAKQSAQQKIVDQINQVASEWGIQVGTFEDVLALLDNPMVPIPEDIAQSIRSVRDMPSSAEELLAMDAESFEAFRQQAASMGISQISDLTQDRLQQLKGAADKAPSRIAEIDVELSNISTRLATVQAMKPQLEEALKKAQEGYAALESGKMTAVNELTKGEITLSNTESQLAQAQEQLEAAQEQFEQARDQAYKQADLSGVLTQEMLANILMAQNFNMPAGYITESGEQYLVKVGDNFQSVDELKDTVLMHLDVDGIGDVRLSDVANVELTDNAGDSYAKVNGNDGVVLSFQKQSTASTADVSGKINDAIETLQKENPDLHITPLMDQGDYIDMVVNSVLSNLLWGGLLAILILILFLRDVRPTLIVACSIPFSLMCAITLMYFSGVTLNLISLSGLALGVGMLVDNSIVVIENIYRLRSEGIPATKAAVRGATQVAGAIFASTLTTICVFLPIVFTQGLSRELFTDMGLTIAYSLLASLVVALTLVPAMGATVLRDSTQKEHKLFDGFVNKYERVLRWALRRKMPVLGGALALLVFSGVMVTQMGTAFIPSMDSPQMSATLTMPEQSTQQETYAMADEVMARMTQVEGVETVGAMQGTGTSSMLGGGSSGGIQFYILLSDDRKVTNVDVKNEIEQAVEDLNCTVDVTESTMDMSMLGGSGLELVITGQDLDEMNSIAEDLREILRQTEGVVDISEKDVTGNPETRITVDKEKAMQYGLTVAQIYSELATALQSETNATTLTIGTDNVPVVIIQDSSAIPQRDSIMQYTFTVTGQDGEEKSVALSEIATKTETDSVPSIHRENNVRTMSVTAGIDEEHNIGLVSREIRDKLDGYALPEGYDVSISGESESINSAMFDLVKMLALAIVFIYLIMVAQFQSLMSPFIVMFTIPLAFTGGLLALLITGKELSIIAMLGFLVLSGVVVNNGIVFVDSINQLRLEGMSRREAIVKTGRTRIRPVLMTALTTIFAMSTMALGIGQGAEMTQPMAIVTIGGLSYATLLTLVIVPILYDIMMKRPLHNPQLDDAAEDAAREVNGL